MSKYLFYTLATAGLLLSTTIAQAPIFQSGPAVLLPTAQPLIPQPAPIPPGPLPPQILDPFQVGAPIIASPFQSSPTSVGCSNNLTPCQVGGNWLCIDSTLMVCGPIICPKEISSICRLGSGTLLCYNPEVLQCTATGELLVIPTADAVASGTANHGAIENPTFVSNGPARF